MRGKRNIRLRARDLLYIIELDRKITILKGLSATGKTTFFNYLDMSERRSNKSGVKISSDAKIVVLNHREWEYQLSKYSNCIIVCDEGLDEIHTKEFADIVNKSDNYFLFVCRSGILKYLSYSVESIVEFSTEKVDSVFVTKSYKRYFDSLKKEKFLNVITEDSKSGYKLFKNILNNSIVTSSNGKDNVYNTVSSLNSNGKVCAIVDGAAFGSCIGRFDKILDKVSIVAPESFEYLLLNTSRVKKYVEDEVTNTSEYCDFNEDIISYERYYTELLKTVLNDKFRVNYSKSHLPKIFENEEVYDEIKKMLPQIDFT